MARDFAPPLPSAVDVGGDVGGADLVGSASENDPLVAGPTSTGSKASVSEGFSPRQRVDRSSGSFSALPESSSSSSEPEVTQAPGAPRLLRAPPEPPPPGLPDDMKFLWDVWQREKPGGRGVLERGRGAKIVEGSASQGEAPAADAPQVARVPAESPPVSEPPLPALNEPGAPADIDTREATAEAPSLRRLARQPATGPSPEPRQPTSPPPARPGAMRMARKPSEAADDPAGVSPQRSRDQLRSTAGPAATEPPPDAPVVDEQRPSPPEDVAGTPAPQPVASDSAAPTARPRAAMRLARSSQAAPPAPEVSRRESGSESAGTEPTSTAASPPPASSAPRARDAVTPRPVRVQRRERATTAPAPAGPPAAEPSPERALAAAAPPTVAQTAAEPAEPPAQPEPTAASPAAVSPTPASPTLRPPRRRLRRKRAQLWLPPTRDRGSCAARCPASVASARTRRASLARSAAAPPSGDSTDAKAPVQPPTPPRRLGRSIARAATGGEVVNARPSDSIALGAGRAPQPRRASPRGRDPSSIQPSRPHLDRAARTLDPDRAAGARAGSTTPARPPARKARDARIGAAARPGARAGAARLGGAARLAAAPRADPAAALARRSPRHPNELRQPPDPASPEHRAPSGGAPDGSPPQARPGPGRADPACSETSNLAGTVAATDDRNRAPSRDPRTASRPRSPASVNPAGCRGASPIGSSAVALHGLPDDGRRDAPGQRRFDTRAAAVDGRRILGIGRRGCDFVRCGWGVVGSGVVGRRRTGRRFGLRPDVPRASAPPAGRTGTTWAGR